MTVSYINEEWTLEYDAMLDIHTGTGYYWKHAASGSYCGQYATEGEAHEAMAKGEVTLEDD